MIASRAEPLVRSGIGLQSCAKLAPDLKPSEGLDHLPNALLFYWFQGYLSAANIYLLNEYTDYIDTGEWSKKSIKEAKKYCKVNVAASAGTLSSAPHVARVASARPPHCSFPRCWRRSITRWRGSVRRARWRWGAR